MTDPTAAVKTSEHRGTTGTTLFRKLARHRLGVLGASTLALLYVVAIFAPFVAPYGMLTRDSRYVHAPPQVPRFIDAEGNFHLRPFVYEISGRLDPETFRRDYEIDTEARRPIYFFVRGEPYRLFGVLTTDLHLFGVAEGTLFLLGTDHLGRDVLSRMIFGARVSLSIGLVGVAIMVVLGTLVGVASGYYGGVIDTVLQRLIEVVMSFPTIPLWMALAAAVPSGWSTVQTFFAVTVILALIRWVNLARQVRGITLVQRELDYVQAARTLGASDARIIVRHLVPNTMTHVLIIATLAVPQMILAETALSFLGLGIQPPAVSWGSLLQAGQNLRTIVQHPWLLAPGVPIVLSVLAFNFVGDALRDALDPHRHTT